MITAMLHKVLILDNSLKTTFIRAVSRENLSAGFQTRSNTYPAVQPQKVTRGLKFGISEVEGLYYLCSENKGADQLRGYHTSDLRLCFRTCKKQVSS